MQLHRFDRNNQARCVSRYTGSAHKLKQYRKLRKEHEIKNIGSWIMYDCTAGRLLVQRAMMPKSEKEDKTIRIGASVTPHAEILKHVNRHWKKEATRVEIEEFTDYIKPNQALVDDELDAISSSISRIWSTGQKG